MAKIKVDGKYYEEGAEPDLGSIQCISDERSPQREYFGYDRPIVKL